MIMHLGARLMERTTPFGLILTGAALALAMPPVRKGLRSAAVMATRGVLMVTDTVRNAGEAVRDEFQDIVAEAREMNCPMCSAVDDHKRRIATATSQGLMSVSNKARSLSEKVKRYSDTDHVNAPEEYDGLEAEEFDRKPL